MLTPPIEVTTLLALFAPLFTPSVWYHTQVLVESNPEAWPHLRATNVTVRLRIPAAKHFKEVENATASIWKISQVAQSTFCRLKGAEVLPAVSASVPYRDGVQRIKPLMQKLAA